MGRRVLLYIDHPDFTLTHLTTSRGTGQFLLAKLLPSSSVHSRTTPDLHHSLFSMKIWGLPRRRDEGTNSGSACSRHTKRAHERSSRHITIAGSSWTTSCVTAVIFNPQCGRSSFSGLLQQAISFLLHTSTKPCLAIRAMCGVTGLILRIVRT